MGSSAEQLTNDRHRAGTVANSMYGYEHSRALVTIKEVFHGAYIEPVSLSENGCCESHDRKLPVLERRIFCWLKEVSSIVGHVRLDRATTTPQWGLHAKGHLHLLFTRNSKFLQPVLRPSSNSRIQLQ